MTCNTCGEKPKDTAKDFTKAVIEINNPETLVLLRKVVTPASMGTEEDVPAAIGKYHNVILYYEANKHTYLYSSDGIPTLLEMDVPQEVWDSIDELQEEIDEIKNNPDVVDIVDTYADLESYDTSGLSDNDIIRILNDETHDEESSYYRWNTATQTWTFIGATGPYYTKDQTDDLLDEKQDSLTAGDNITIEDNVISAGSWITDLTDADYDYPDDNSDGIALWRLSTGMYRISANVKIYLHSAHTGSTLPFSSVVFIDSEPADTYCKMYLLGGSPVLLKVVDKATGNLVSETSILLASQVVDALTSTAANAPLSANQGRVLKGLIDDAVTNIPTVVQSRGNSTTDVMSQAATTSLVYADIRPASYGSLIRIGGGASNTSNILYEGIAIGADSKTTGNYGVALGTYAWVEAANGIAIGGGSGTQTAPRIRAPYSIAIGDRIDIESAASYSVAIGTGGAATGRSILAKGSVSLGAFSKATSNGEMNIGLSEATASQQTTYGYNGSEYRLLTGLYDPQNDHDAATKGYCDNAIINGGTTAPTTTTVGAVGTQYTYVDTSGTPTAHLCVCVAVDTSVTPNTYTWQTLI